MSLLKLPFGIKNGVLVDVDSVSSGIGCDCLCPFCEAKLIAKKGETKAHHFAHYNTRECEWAVETALHLMTKNILLEKKKILLPPVSIKYNDKKQATVYPPQWVTIEKVEQEKASGDVRPDLVCTAKGERFFIEIAVTHYVDGGKLQKLRKLDISTMEIDFGELDRRVSKGILEDILLSENSHKTWIYNRKAEAIKREIMALAKLKQPLRLGKMNPQIEDCPRNDSKYYPYADLYTDCMNCNYFVGSKFKYLCTAESKNELLSLAKRYRIIKGGTTLIETTNLSGKSKKADR